METKLLGKGKEVVISPELPTVIIGERINPTGNKRLAAELIRDDFDFLRAEAMAQAEAGAELVDVNVGLPEVDECSLLPEAVRIVGEAVDIPISIDTANTRALANALALCPGKALVNSVSGEEARLETVLPLVKEYGAAVIGLTMDHRGVPYDPQERLAIAEKIVEQAAKYGIPADDVVIDCLALTVGADHRAGLITLKTIRLVREKLGNNITLGASNVSYGLPRRRLITSTFISLAIQAGVTCVIADATKVKGTTLATDLLLGKDKYAMRFISYIRGKKG